MLTLPTSALVAVADDELNESATLDVAVAPLLAAAAPTAEAMAEPVLLFCPELFCELLSWLDVALSLAIAPDPDWVLLLVAVCVLPPLTLLTVLSGSAANAFRLRAIEMAAAMMVRFMKIAPSS
ncbi:MAG: hypothetical protein H7267_15125 [Sandarakinorhabdus sp.]|nr:hypothetical protein [Sandarakinorhabdus sp.]